MFSAIRTLLISSRKETRNLLGVLAVSQSTQILLSVATISDYLQKIGSKKPEILILDLPVLKPEDLSIVGEIRQIDPQIIVLVALPAGRQDLILAAMKNKASNFFTQNVNEEEMSGLLKKYTAIVIARRTGIEILNVISHQQFRIRLDNDIEMIPHITEFLVRATHNAFSPKARMEIRLGLTELITNAIEHGNLEISYQEKTAALDSSGDSIENLFNERKKHPVFGSRKTEINFSQTDTFCEWVVIDEGKGFDWKNLPDPLSPEQMLLAHGRGIFLARFQFNELEFLGTGNMVRMRKVL
ncbi:MAG: ATP-binding protein [Candidatus Riflebacteria bacterium]|nr:ATP-binding protein [Candidatus Riflebacteria bacterium]